jgi:hypothetical protein
MTKTKSKFYKAVLVLYTFISIASTCYLLMRPQQAQINNDYEQTRQELKQIQDYLQQHHLQYEKTIDSLHRQSDSLQSELIRSQKKLKQARLQSHQLENEIQTYAKSFEKDTSMKKDHIAFDSLYRMSVGYIHSSHSMDSLCQEQNQMLSKLLLLEQNKFKQCDSSLKLNQEKSRQLLNMSTSLNQELLQSQNKLRKSKRGNKLLSISAVFLSGFIVCSFIHP